MLKAGGCVEQGNESAGTKGVCSSLLKLFRILLLLQNQARSSLPVRWGPVSCGIKVVLTLSICRTEERHGSVCPAVTSSCSRPHCCAVLLLLLEMESGSSDLSAGEEKALKYWKWF